MPLRYAARYQFPDRTSRLVLISSGGPGPELTLRQLALLRELPVLVVWGSHPATTCLVAIPEAS